MTDKFDKLGRRIPKFDRSAAAKKAAKTLKEKEGNDVHARFGTVGGRVRSRGYFGTLKDQGKTDEIKKLSQKAAEARKKNSTDKKKTVGSVKRVHSDGARKT